MAKFRDITFNGRTMHSFGFYLKKGAPLIDFPTRQTNTTLIAGSVVGEAITDKGTYGNIERVYDFRTIPTKTPYPNDEGKFLKTFINWAKDNRDTYGKLYDTQRSGYFCNAILKEIKNFKKNFDGCYDVTLVFNCQPYWYSELGQRKIVNTSTGSGNPITFIVNNGETETAYPYFKITLNTGSALSSTLTVNSKSMTFDTFTDYLEIDSEIKQVFKGSDPKNDLVTDGITFPELKSGNNTVTFTPLGGTWTLEMIPRWRTL